MRASAIVVAVIAVAALIALASAYVENNGMMTYDELKGQPYKVDYDYRAIRINGRRVLLQSAGIHYPRSSPSMWPQMMKYARASGLNTIQTYVFHNYHEYEQGVWDWETESRNLGAFLQAAADEGLFVNLRIGPYVCAEWFNGGIPLWTHDQGFPFRDYNPGWLNYMQNMMESVVDYVQPYLARNGGPIILTQIENEYGAAGGDTRRAAYISWCGNLTKTLNTDTVWVMCQQPDAPTPTIYTCNGDDCSGYVQHQQIVRQQPAMWTENWIAWFQHWGESVPTRDSRNIAYDVLSFFAMGGSYMNYYMWQGGTNFGRTVGGPDIITSYDYDGCLDEFGVPHEPKYTHTNRMHAVLAMYAPALLGNNFSTAADAGNGVELYTYGQIGSTGSVAFLRGTKGDTVTATFNGQSYLVSGYAVLVIDGLINVKIYDSNDIADIPVPTPQKGLPSVSADGPIAWYNEPVGIWSKQPVVSKLGPLEQLNLTSYKSIYMWYSTSVQITQEQISKGSITLGLSNAGDHEYFFLDHDYVGLANGASDLKNFSIVCTVKQAGTHTFNILSMTQGLYNGADYRLSRGLNGAVLFDNVDLTKQSWSHQPGTLGEYLHAYTDAGQKAVPWNMDNLPSDLRWTWLKMSFITPVPQGDPAYATWQFDMGSMGKGELWVNGFMVGAYWTITDKNGVPSQRYYHIPRDYLMPAGQSNLVVLLEEIGGNPGNIVLMQRNAIGVGSSVTPSKITVSSM